MRNPSAIHLTVTAVSALSRTATWSGRMTFMATLESNHASPGPATSGDALDLRKKLSRQPVTAGLRTQNRLHCPAADRWRRQVPADGSCHARRFRFCADQIQVLADERKQRFQFGFAFGVELRPKVGGVSAHNDKRLAVSVTLPQEG